MDLTKIARSGARKLKSLMLPADLTADELARKYGGTDGNWECLLIGEAAEPTVLFPGLRIADIKAREPVALLLIEDDDF